MTEEILRRVQTRLTRPRLARVLAGDSVPTDATETSIVLGPVRAAIDGLDPALSGSSLDLALVEPLHQALIELTRAEAADMRCWHWLAASAFPDYVWRRWRPGGVPGDQELEAALTPATYGRFAGAPSLVGVSRNTFARLWWLGTAVEGDYDRARAALARQDMFQAIFERLFGVYRPAAEAALTAFIGRSEDEIRARARWLNVLAGTTLLEALDEAQIAAILEAD
jgi:hypothetical protein